MASSRKEDEVRKEDTTYFKTDKMIDCPCGCGMAIENEELWDKLEAARVIAGVPFVITSGARCPWYNDVKKGFSKTSSHRLGLAVDIATPDSTTRFKILKALFAAGFTRIGYNGPKKFLHVDVDKDKSQDLLFDY